MSIMMNPPAVQAAGKDCVVESTQKKLIKAIDALPGNSGRERMELFVQTCLYATAGCTRVWSNMSLLTVGLNPEVFQFRKQGFDKEKTELCKAAMAEYLKGVGECPKFVDLLSMPFAMTVGAYDNGQNFTPWDLATLTTALAYDDEERHNKNLTRLADPCCGAGALILARLHTIVNKQPDTPLTGHTVYVNDLDPLCAAMTALQLLANQVFHVMPIGVVQVEVGNALIGSTQVAMRTDAIGLSA